MVTIRAEQQAQLTEAAVQAFRQRIVVYLRQHLPEQTASLTDLQLIEKVRVWHNLASSYSVASQRAIAKWCYLSLVTSDRFPMAPQFHDYLHAGGDPDERVEQLMRVLAVRLHLSEVARA